MRLSPKITVGITLTFLVGVALFFRIVLPYDQVFRGDMIKLTSTDAAHYMRLVDNLAHNFPKLTMFDPYYSYPVGFYPGSQNLFVYLVSGTAWIIGLGAPSQHLVDVVGVYFPAVIGALTVIPVYFLGKTLFNRWAGVIAGGLVAIFPGETMGRSILGFTVRDTLEVLFTVLVMLFLILAIKSARENQMSFNQLRHFDWPVVAKPIVYSLIAGLFLGLYLLTWIGAFLFLIVIFVYFIIQYIVDHLNHKTTDYLGIIGTIIFMIALIMFLPDSKNVFFLVPLIINLVTPALLSGVSWLMTKKAIKPTYYPLILAGIGIAGLIVFQMVNPSLLRSITEYLSRAFIQPAQELTTSENAPILFPAGSFTISVVWGNFTTSAFLSLISLGILLFLVVKKPDPSKTLFLVWSVVLIVYTLAMRRFAVFLAINVALLTSYLAWLVIRFIVPEERLHTPYSVAKKAKKKKLIPPTVKKNDSSFRRNFARKGLAIALVFFVVFLPNISPAANEASGAIHAFSDAWGESLSWMKDNTPDPFGDPDTYYEFYRGPFDYPKSVYAVLSWWDYGYEIIRTAHRIPNVNPGGGNREAAAKLFTAQNESSANEIINQLNARYIIIDDKMALGMFPAITTYADSNFEEFFSVFYVRQGSTMSPVMLFYPEYYRSLAVRLYAFNGDKVVPKNTTVISYQEVFQDGQLYKIITTTDDFSNFEDAVSFIQRQISGNYRIVGNSPFISPVPLEASNDYQLVYSSKGGIAQEGVGTIPEVKIFEYHKKLAFIDQMR